MSNNNEKKIFLSKKWIISETPYLINIMAPEEYGQEKNNLDRIIMFPRAMTAPVFKDQDLIIVTVDLRKEYAILSFDRNKAEVNKMIVLGEQLYQELKLAQSKTKSQSIADSKQSCFSIF